MNRLIPFDWIVAIRFLREGLVQTLFIIGGIALGVGVIVFMSALLSGMQANFIKRVLTSQPHIQLITLNQASRPLRFEAGQIEDPVIEQPTQRVTSVDQWPKIVSRMRNLPEVIAVSPNVSGSALVVRGEASRAVSMTGIEPESYFKIVRLPDYIVSGEARITSQDVIIGTELASDLGVKVGDKINLRAGTGATLTLTISAIFDLGSKGTNQHNIYVALRIAQSLLGMIGGITNIDLSVKDIYAAETLAQEIQASNLVEADSWIKTNAQFFTAIQAQTFANTLIRLTVGLSVAFGIAAVLIVSVIQRSKNIGILRAMGTSRGQIMRVFLIQGGLLGLFGALLGMIMGGGGVIYWHASWRMADGSEMFPLVLEPSMFFITALLATVTGLLAATAPALRAAKLDPVEAINHQILLYWHGFRGGGFAWH